MDEERRAISEAFDNAKVVRNEKDGDFAGFQFFQFANAAIGEDGVAHSQSFVDDEDFRFDVDSSGEGKANIHATGIFFDGAIHEVPDFSKSGDGGKNGVDFAALDSHDFTVQVNIFTPGEFRVETSA